MYLYQNSEFLSSEEITAYKSLDSWVYKKKNRVKLYTKKKA